MSENIINISKAGFKALLENAPQGLLVDFWAPWCSPCRMIAPELEALKVEMGDSLVVAKVNVDDEPELAQAYGVQSIPNLVLFKNGEPVHQMVGFKDRRAIRQEVEHVLSASVS